MLHLHDILATINGGHLDEASLSQLEVAIREKLNTSNATLSSWQMLRKFPVGSKVMMVTPSNRKFHGIKGTVMSHHRKRLSLAIDSKPPSCPYAVGTVVKVYPHSLVADIPTPKMAEAVAIPTENQVDKLSVFFED